MKTSSNLKRKRSTLTRLPLAVAICLAMSSAALAQESAADPSQATADAPASTTKKAPTLAAVQVTAQKRTENLQEVPISILVLGEQTLDQHNITTFEQYVQLLPSVAFQRGQTGASTPYMRGVASGENGNHSGPQPSVGVYFDEQSVTTIGGVLDVHIYDVERIEALAGPQGTLYGASSQAGTIRIISNKPDTKAFSAAYSLEANTVTDGGTGYVAEAFVNAPFSDRAALRAVVWSEKTAGYIDNVYGTRTFPSSEITIDNADLAKDNYNDIETDGARLALKIDLNDQWSITPTVMTQTQDMNGAFGVDPAVGDLAVTHFSPEGVHDRWTQAALTVQGKIGNFDVTYAYAHLDRDVDSAYDYTDYTFWYDTLYGSGAYIYDNDGTLVNPTQFYEAVDGFTKRSHELRISSPAENRFRFVGGWFWQQQSHDILQNYQIVGDLADDLSVTGWPNTIWLTKQVRQDHDQAVYGEISYDFTDKFSATGGVRFFQYDNSLKGFFGYAAGYSGNYGEALCASPWVPFKTAPCTNLDDSIKKNDQLGKINVTYKIDDNKLIYATWSQGYRPGGVNRNASFGTYLQDNLTNYEFGWKTSWAENRVVWNGAIFQENWNDIQFSFLPPSGSGLTVIRNVGGSRIRGLETDLNWAVTYNFQLTGGLALYDAKLTTNYCGSNDADGNPETNCADPLAPKGARLPVTAKYKGNLTGRYSYAIGEMDAYVQGALVAEGERRSALIVSDAQIKGDLPAYTLWDFSTGIKKDSWALDLFIRNAFNEKVEYARYNQCATSTCGAQTYRAIGQPRTIGIRFSQEF